MQLVPKAFIPSQKQALTTLGLLGILLLLVYGRSLGFGFVDWDDKLLIVENPIVHSFTPATIKEAFTSYDPELYIPLTLVGYQLDHLFVGLHPFLYHLENLAFHLLNSALVAWFVLLLTGRRWVAAVTALLFAVHPLHTEAVVWASSRKDVQAACFFLLSLIAYQLFRAGGEKRLYRYSVLALLLALLSKVIAITLPLILLLLDWREGRKIDRANLREKLPFFALSILFGVIALGGKYGSDELVAEKLLIGSKAVVFYLGKLLLPAGLSVLYPYTEPPSLTNIGLLVPFFLVIAITILAWKSSRKTREILFAWLFFLITVAPTFSNFARGKDLLKDIYFASDRYTYLPSIAAFFLAALLLHRLLHKRAQIVQGLIAVLVVLFSFQAYAQSLTWENSETLFTNVLEHYPNSHLAHNNLGSLRYREGKEEEALQHYLQSLAIRPNSQASYNLGQLYSAAGQTLEAMQAYRDALKNRPDDVPTLVNLGVLEMRAGDLPRAIGHLKQARDLDPASTFVHYNLGAAYEVQGNIEEAVGSYRRVLELDPEDAEVSEILQRLELKNGA